MRETNTRARCGLFFAAVLVLSAAVRCALALLPSRTAAIYGDELLALEIAKNIRAGGGIALYHTPVAFLRVLYPLLLSPFWMIRDAGVRLAAMSVFNALLMTSALIPGWLLARRLLKEAWQIRLSLLFLALAPDMGLAVPFLADALYFPLLLWGVYFFVRFLQKPESRVFPAVLGCWACLLVLTKGSGWAFLAAVLVAAGANREGSRGQRVRHVLVCLGTFLVPWLAVRLLCGGLSFSAVSALFAEMTGPGRVFFAVYSAVLLLFWFALSLGFFPAVLPLSRAGSLSHGKKRLLLFAALYGVLTAVGSAFAAAGGDLDENRVQLRMMIGAFYPFLLLFFALPESPEEGKPSPWALLWGAGLALLFAAAPVLRSVVDAPGLHAWAALRQNNAAFDWILRGGAAATALAGYLLYRRFGMKALRGFLLPLVGAAMVLNQFAFLRDVRQEETAPSGKIVQEAAALEEALRGEEGNLLILAEEAEDPNLKALTARVSRNGYLLLRKDLLTMAGEDASAQLSMATTKIPYLFNEYAPGESVAPGLIDLVLCPAGMKALDAESYEDITPEGVSRWRLLRAKDATVLAAADLVSRPLGEEITFGLDQEANFRNLPVSGFLEPEEESTWAAGREATVIVKPTGWAGEDLVLRWQWTATDPLRADPLPCQVYAGETLVSEEPLAMSGGRKRIMIPASAIGEDGKLVLRFVFPSIKESAEVNGWNRTAAFRSLRVTPAEDAFFVPSGIRDIPEEAFAGMNAKMLYLAPGVATIGSKAFANWKNLERVYIPATVWNIAEDAFEGCPDTMVWVGPANGTAKKFAEEHGIAYEIE